MLKVKIILIALLGYTNLIQFTESKKYRIQPDEEILQYELDKKVPSLIDFFNIENLFIEHIDDDYVEMGGYAVCTKAADSTPSIQVHIRTQYFDKSTWNDGVPRITMMNACLDMIDPSRPWYNITKLITPDVCPPKEGDIWRVEKQQLTAIFDLPPTTPIAPWKAFVLATQGPPAFETWKAGFGIKFELLKVD